ncbi:hypothetical protein C8C83_4498 [Flavobacterium sp. 90]|uniref:hypothetical protein n=1 Tax=unclassified Flavobacterium TaxID=196869 RepID=UPI000EAE9108|nr:MULTISPECIES: hypothetical protein [unclassified Flavobacterium]RKR05165.1 hypothetical protein C8C82_4839 [Flavobacterium sp. 81]TCK56481.1 hypothetical protein C8C83_4498 [Flavobacterium sp. 90]
MTKTILAVWQSEDKGKSETLREFATLLLATYPTHRIIFPITGIIPSAGDFRLVVEINGQIIAVETQGDPKTDLEKRLFDLADNFNCELILCATRTRGETVWAVNEVVNRRGFEPIWTSTYEIRNNSNYTLVNRLKASHILDLLQTLNII